LLAAPRGNATAILKDAATAYEVDTEANCYQGQAGVRSQAKAKKEPKSAAKPALKVKKEA